MSASWVLLLIKTYFSPGIRFSFPANLYRMPPIRKTHLDQSQVRNQGRRLRKRTLKSISRGARKIKATAIFIPTQEILRKPIILRTPAQPIGQFSWLITLCSKEMNHEDEKSMVALTFRLVLAYPQKGNQEYLRHEWSQKLCRKSSWSSPLDQ